MAASPDPRQQFLLEQVRAARSVLAVRVRTRKLEEVSPYGVSGLRLRLEGVPGYVDLVPVTIRDNVRMWQPFPADGLSHIQAVFVDGEDSVQEHALLCDGIMLGHRVNDWYAALQPVSERCEVFSRDELPACESIREARKSADADLVLVEETTPVELVSADVEELRQNLNRARIAAEFPRADDGRLALKTTVLLAPCQDSLLSHRDRLPWLSVSGPVRRRDPQQLTVGIQQLIGANHAHDWSTVPQL